MCSKTCKQNLILLIGIILLFCLLHAPIHWVTKSTNTCLYCLASTERTRIIGIPLRQHLQETAMLKYWKENVDPHHKHVWITGPRAIRYGNPFDSGFMIDNLSNSCHPRWKLNDIMIPILESLPTPQARKDFVKNIWGPGMDGNSKELERLRKTVDTIEKTYYEDSNRKDWPIILEKLGCLSNER